MRPAPRRAGRQRAIRRLPPAASKRSASSSRPIVRDAGSYYRLSNYLQKIPSLIGIPKRQPLTFVLGATAQTDLRHAPLLTRGLRPFFARFALRKLRSTFARLRSPAWRRMLECWMTKSRTEAWTYLAGMRGSPPRLACPVRTGLSIISALSFSPTFPRHGITRSNSQVGRSGISTSPDLHRQHAGSCGSRYGPSVAPCPNPCRDAGNTQLPRRLLSYSMAGTRPI